eukprot:scaffold2168_cov131-Skeletonema_dohrnii-CCMP3373.AAC.6
MVTFVNLRTNIGRRSVDTSGNPDLMDATTYIISQFIRGPQQLFKYDLERKSAEVFKEVDTIGPKVEQPLCHEATFYPSDTSSVIAASTNKMLDKKNLMINIYDHMHERVIAQYLTVTNDNKGISSYDEEVCQRIPRRDPSESDAHNFIALFRLEFSVDDVASGKAEPVSSAYSFSIIRVHNVGVGALEEVDYIMVAWQWLLISSMIECYSLRSILEQVMIVTEACVSQHRGYIMPHGVARRHFSVTTCGENSVVISHKDSIGALSREMIHLNSNVASSFSVFSICSIMVDLYHVRHIRSDSL